jgi:hypothetical protein
MYKQGFSLVFILLLFVVTYRFMTLTIVNSLITYNFVYVMRLQFKHRGKLHE